ncbi:MAG: biliverdin-producing heme oxygenase [Pyrinomonadaceae bacterium]
MMKLKEATAQQHEALESTVNVMDSVFSMDDYRILIQKFYSFYSAIEPKLAEMDWGSVSYNFDERLKTPKLKRDLENLGLDTAEIPICENLPQIDTFQQALGALYVLEGATLGGQVIKRHLRSSLDLDESNGGDFFAGYGELTGPRWKEFSSFASEYVEKNGGDEEVIEAAKSTFDSFKNCFETTTISAAGA